MMEDKLVESDAEIREEKNKLQQEFFKKSVPNPLSRICAWGIDLCIGGALATACTSMLGNSVQDAYFGPLSFYLICGFLYSSIMESSSWQATLGKRILRIKVIRKDGLPLGVWNAASRNVLKSLAFITLGISYAIFLIPPFRSSLHDLLSFSRVVKARADGDVNGKWCGPTLLNRIIESVGLLISSLTLFVIFGVALGVAINRSKVYDAYRQLSPYMNKVEKSYKETKTYPSSVTSDTRGLKDEDILSGSDYKAKYFPKSGTFSVEILGIPGRMVMGYLPENHRLSEKNYPSWVCIGLSEKIEQERLFALLTPSSCAVTPFKMYQLKTQGK